MLIILLALCCFTILLHRPTSCDTPWTMFYFTSFFFRIKSVHWQAWYQNLVTGMNLWERYFYLINGEGYQWIETMTDLPVWLLNSFPPFSVCFYLWAVCQPRNSLRSFLNLLSFFGYLFTTNSLFPFFCVLRRCGFKTEEPSGESGKSPWDAKAPHTFMVHQTTTELSKIFHTCIQAHIPLLQGWKDGTRMSQP